MYPCLHILNKQLCSAFLSCLKIQMLTEKKEAAWHVSKNLSKKVEAVCLEECLRFLER